MPMTERDTGVIKLCSAVRKGNIDDITAIVKAGVDINSQDKNGETAIHIAAWNDRADIITEIINTGGDVDIQNQNGQTPLHIAATYGYNDVVRSLLVAHPDIDRCTQYSEMAALHLACLNGHTDTVQLLLQHGADPDILDVINKPAEFYADSSDMHEVFKDDAQRRLLQHYVSDLDYDLDKSMQEMKLDKPKKIVHKKMKYSRLHKRKMKLNVFDRLTRRKSQLLKENK